MKNFANNKIKIIKYIKTALITFTVVAIIVVSSLFTSYKSVESKLKKSSKYNEKIEYYMVGLMIEQAKYFKNLNPWDYNTDARLGYLYMIYKDYDSAEKSYKSAIIQAPNNVYEPHFGLASVYIREQKYDEAETFLKGITDKPNQKLIKFKAEIYDRLGRSYYNDGYYYKSAKSYEKSLFYYKKFKKPPKKVINSIEEKIAVNYIYMADLYLDAGKYNYTLKCLNKAEQYMSDSLSIKYKKALALIDSNPELAEKYMYEVYLKDPEHINFYIYYDLLKKIVTKKYHEQKFSEAKLYKYRAEKITNFVQENIIYKDEVVFDVIEKNASIKKKKVTLNLRFKIRNLSRLDLRKLYIDIVFKNNNKEIYRFEQEVLNSVTYLSTYEETPIFEIKIDRPIKYSKKQPPNISADVVIYKNIKYKYPVGSFNIPITQN